eukprot:TRINITY_DN1298_c0_g2_i19.p1 TRINITY_DN1298_c0_g2~~TRINITY_DN1298_c0_g2_i19.p1  ORF type:complete len:265 (-),score=48.00 TRINITY_DN1298_c0_g2_i19:100-783(-)
MNPMFMNQMSPNPPMKSSRSNRKVSPDKKSEENDDQSTSNENPLSPNTDKMNQGVPMGNGSPMQRNQTQTGQENLKMDGANQNLRGGINPGQSMGGYNQAQTGSNESFVPNMNTGGFSMNGMGNPQMNNMRGMGSPHMDGMGGFQQGMGSPHMDGMGGFQQGMGSPHMDVVWVWVDSRWIPTRNGKSSYGWYGYGWIPTRNGKSSYGWYGWIPTRNGESSYGRYGWI